MTSPLLAAIVATAISCAPSVSTTARVPPPQERPAIAELEGLAPTDDSPSPPSASELQQDGTTLESAEPTRAPEAPLAQPPISSFSVDEIEGLRALTVAPAQRLHMSVSVGIVAPYKPAKAVVRLTSLMKDDSVDPDAFRVTVVRAGEKAPVFNQDVETVGPAPGSTTAKVRLAPSAAVDVPIGQLAPGLYFLSIEYITEIGVRASTSRRAFRVRPLNRREEDDRNSLVRDDLYSDTYDVEARRAKKKKSHK